MKLFTKIKFYLLSLFIINGFTWLNTIAMETNTQSEKNITEITENKNKLISASSESANSVIVSEHPLPKTIDAKTLRRYLLKANLVRANDLAEISDEVMMAIFTAGRDFALSNEIATTLNELGKRIAMLEETANQIKGNYTAAKEILIQDLNVIKFNFVFFIAKIKKDVSFVMGQNQAIRQHLAFEFIRCLIMQKKIMNMAKQFGSMNSTLNHHNSSIQGHEARLASQEVSLRNTAETVGNTYGTVSQHSERIHGLEERTRELEGSILSLNNLNKLLEGDWAKTLEMMSYIGYPTMSYSNKILGKIPVINKFSGAMEDTFKKLSAFFLLYRTGKLCAPWIKSMLYSSITKKLKSLSPNIYDLLLGLNSKDNSYCGRF